MKMSRLNRTTTGFARIFLQLWLGILLGHLLVPVPTQAVIILEKNVTEPIRGVLIEADAVRVIVDVLQPDGAIRRRIIPRSSIDEMVEAVSRDRLAELRSERPQEYRDYAEELAGKTNDPEARVTAIRLYQIAAHLAPDKLGRSCLLGMVSLARDPNEERKFRAAAYLIDTEHNRTVLRPSGTPPAADKEWTEEQRQQLRMMLRALRELRPGDARGIARRAPVQAAMPRLAGVLTLADFAELRTGERLPAGLLVKVLAAELALEAPASGRLTTESTETRSAGINGWSNVSDPKRMTPVPVLALEYLTEFDPRQCHYRNGKWEL